MKIFSLQTMKLTASLRALILFLLLLTLGLASVAVAQESEIDFNNLSLDQAIALSLGHSEFLQQVRAEVEGNKGSLMATKSGQLPQLDLAGQYSRNLKKPAFFLPADMASAFGGVSGPIPMSPSGLAPPFSPAIDNFIAINKNWNRLLARDFDNFCSIITSNLCCILKITAYLSE